MGGGLLASPDAVCSAIEKKIGHFVGGLCLFQHGFFWDWLHNTVVHSEPASAASVAYIACIVTSNCRLPVMVNHYECTGGGGGGGGG